MPTSNSPLQVQTVILLLAHLEVATAHQALAHSAVAAHQALAHSEVAAHQALARSEEVARQALARSVAVAEYQAHVLLVEALLVAAVISVEEDDLKGKKVI